MIPRVRCISACSLVAVLTLPVMPASSAGDDTAPTRKEFLAKYSPALRKLEEFYKHVHGKGTYTYKSLAQGYEEVLDSEFAVAGDRWRLVQTIRKETAKKDKTKGQLKAFVCTPSLAFRLRRDPQRKDCVVQWIGNDASADYFKATKTLMRHKLQPFAAPCSLETFAISTLLSHSAFTIDDVSAVKQNSPGLRVSFQVDPHDPADRLIGNGSLSGWFVVLPEMAWSVDRYEISYHARPDKKTSEYTTTDSGVLHYEGSSSSFPLLKRLESHSSFNGKPSDMTDILITELIPGDAPDEDFTAGAFGVYVGNLQPPSKPHVYYWLILLAVIGFVLASVLHLLSKRRTRGT